MTRREALLLVIIVIIVIAQLWSWYSDGGWLHVIVSVIVSAAFLYGGWRFLCWVEKGRKHGNEGRR